jgi:hypothetical protein
MLKISRNWRYPKAKYFRKVKVVISENIQKQVISRSCIISEDKGVYMPKIFRNCMAIARIWQYPKTLDI